MKIMTKDDLILVLTHNTRGSFSEDGIKVIFETYADEWFVCDGELAKVIENKNMKKLRMEIKKEAKP